MVNPTVQRRVDDLTYSARQGILEEAFAILMETDAEDASLWTQTVEEAIWQQRIAREVCFYLPLHFKRILLTILTCPLIY